MRTTLLFAIISLVGSVALAAETQKMDPKKAEMMKKWQEFATPGEPHKILAGFAGKWKYTSKWWEAADAKPEESKGTSNNKMIMGGRFLQQEVKGKSMGMPFEGLGVIGYDNLKKKYESTWLDNMGTGTMKGTGDYDATTQTLKESGEASCPMTDNKAKPFKSEWKVVSKDNFTLTMWGPGKDGKEYKQMELDFKRK